MIRAAVVGVVLAVTLGAAPASAYVRKRTDDGLPQYWSGSCILLTAYPNGYTGLTVDEIAKSVGAAAHAWGPNGVSCGGGTHPYLEIVPAMGEGGVGATGVAANDGFHNVVFVTSRWADDRPFNALALTQSWNRPDGRIVDADIEINVDPLSLIDWRDLDPTAPFVGSNGLQVADLQNALTHEVGHLLGLDHTCDADGPDDQGNPVPDCLSAPPAIQHTVMYNGVLGQGETSKRFLAPDDARAVCEIYAQASDPRSCALDQPNDGCGCGAGGASPGRPPVAALGAIVLLAAAALRARRARRADRAPTARRG